MPQPTKPAASGHSGNPVLIATLIFSGILFAAFGTFLPGLLEMTGIEGTILSIAFYAAGAGDIAIALWLRSRLKKAQRANSSGGTVQRQ